MNHVKDVVLLANEYSYDFAERVSSILKNKDIDFSLEKIECKSFPDGNRYVQVGQNVRKNSVFVIQSYIINEPIKCNWDLLLTADALKRCECDDFRFFVSFLDGRQDTKKDGRVAINAKMIADLLDKAGGRKYNGFSSINMHSAQQMGFFDVSVDNLDAMPLFVWYIKNVLFKDFYKKNIFREKLVVVAPDQGSSKTAKRFADLLGCDIAYADKNRTMFDDGGKSNVNKIRGSDINGKIALIIDDIFDSGGTLEENASILRDNYGVSEIYGFFTHCLASEKRGVKAEDRMRRVNLKAITTDTTGRDLEYLEKNKDWLICILSVSPIVAEFIYRDTNGLSVSEMFKDEKIISNMLSNLDPKLFVNEIY
ncbi:MAG: ribose-phosphate diphosphokinase [archaeon]